MNHLNHSRTFLFTATYLGLLLLSFTAGCSRNENQNNRISRHSQPAQSEDEQMTFQEPVPSIRDDNDLSQYLSDQDTLLSEMMEQMAVEPSGSASVDFLNGMVPHHDSAIRMAQSYLQYQTADSDLRQIAQEIIEAQTEEIEEMTRLIREITAAGETDEKEEQNYLDAYASMMARHQHRGHSPADPEDMDEAFAQGMIMHHQMAVDMAKAVLDCTDHAQVRTLAELIIDTQEQEIKKMEEILNRS